MKPITIDVWGPYACFTPPYANVERMSYDVPTPSAMRGVISAIYSKPTEFYWTISKIEVMNPIRRLSCTLNEVTTMPTAKNPLNVNAKGIRTQRAMSMLADVRYRVTAVMHPRQPGADFETKIRKQALRRISHGQCFKQPYLGMRDFTCFFQLSDFSETPIAESKDYGLMTYDTHDLHDQSKCDKLRLSLYHCEMVDGVIDVPDYDDNAVLKVS